jgi:hypothetical protein
VEELGSSDAEESEPLSVVKSGKVASLDSATRRQLAGKRCPELERVGVAQWKHQCAVAAFLEAADIQLECKQQQGATRFTKLKPARLQQQAATEFRCNIGNELSHEVLETLGFKESQLQSLQQDFHGDKPLGRKHLRIAASKKQFNVFIIEPPAATADVDDAEPVLSRYSCVSTFDPKWLSTALYVWRPAVDPGHMSDDKSQPPLRYEILRQSSSGVSVWDHSSSVVKV